MVRENFIAEDKKVIVLAVWDKVDNPKGVVQMVHGMAEHIARYDEFANFLNANGYIVVGDDHRAHGLTDKDALGLAGEGDLFEKTVADEIAITKMLKEKYALPIVLIGHSYGSFLTQRYITLGTENLAGIILSGSASMTGAMVNIGYSLAKSKSKKHKDEQGVTFANLTFKKYDKKFREGINGWLSRDLAEVGKYNTNPLNGFICSNGFYRYFFNGLKTIAKHKYTSIDTSKKMLIVSGDKDMVGGCGKLVKKLYKRYRDLGCNVSVKLFENARHELTNEINRKEVFEYLLEFVNSCINIQSVA